MSRVTMKIDKKYLSLPISRFVGTRTVCVKKDGNLLDDFTLRIDFVNPRAYVCYDVSSLIGQEITFEVSPDIDAEKLADCRTDVYDTDEFKTFGFRPLVHFTAPFGWINDPNGLVVYTSKVTGKTLYHLFCQHNPYDWVWGNMHWGHAVSEDLMHWEYLGEGLTPDENGTMFSGSAIVDYDNKSGLKSGEEDVILLYYTCAGHNSVRSAGKEFTQCMAYSTDGGRTFKKYENNPVVGHIAADNRDPKVIRCDELNCFIMAIYLDGNEYCILTSDNLLAWRELQRISIDGDAECPDIYPLTATNGERKWILSGASHHYVVGDFTGGRFVPCAKAKFVNYGSTSYAAQTYSYPNNARRIQIAWDRDTFFGDNPICGQMGIPCELTLTEENGEYYLCANPAPECEKAVRETKTFTSVSLGEDSFTLPMDESAYILELSLDGSQSADICIELFGQRIHLDGQKNALRVFDRTMPLNITGSPSSVCIVIDKGSLEAFVGGGKAMMTVPWTLDFNQKSMTVSSSAKSVIEKLTVKKLAL